MRSAGPFTTGEVKPLRKFLIFGLLRCASLDYFLLLLVILLLVVFEILQYLLFALSYLHLCKFFIAYYKLQSFSMILVFSLCSRMQFLSHPVLCELLTDEDQKVLVSVTVFWVVFLKFIIFNI